MTTQRGILDIESSNTQCVYHDDLHRIMLGTWEHFAYLMLECFHPRPINNNQISGKQVKIEASTFIRAGWLGYVHVNFLIQNINVTSGCYRLKLA